MYLANRNIYGSSLLGQEEIQEVVASTDNSGININTNTDMVIGDKRYTLSNHLGNVHQVVTDRKLPEEDNGDIAYFYPDIVSHTDFMPYGMEIESRSSSTSETDFGFNGMYKDDEWKRKGNSYDFGARMYDSRIGRWLSRDPLEALQPDQSPYKAFLNNPIIYVDPEGETEYLKIVYKDESTGESMTLKVTVSNDLDASHLFSDGFVRYHDYSTILTITKNKDGDYKFSYNSGRVLENGGNNPRIKLLYGLGGVPLAKAMLTDQPGGFYMTSKNGMGTIFKSKNNPKYIGNIDAIFTAFGAVQKLGTLKDVATGKKHGLDALDELVFEQILDAFLPVVIEEMVKLNENDNKGSTDGIEHNAFGDGKIDNTWDVHSVDNEGNEWYLNSKTQDTIYGYPKSESGKPKQPTLKCKSCEK